MIIVLLVGFIVAVFFLWAWVDNARVPEDSRETYLRDDAGKVWALRVAGPVGDVPNHEAFIHDGTPHQNPAVRDWTATVWFIIIPFPEQRQERYYPLTDNGFGVDLQAIQQRVNGGFYRIGEKSNVKPCISSPAISNPPFFCLIPLKYAVVRSPAISKIKSTFFFMLVARR